MNKILAANWKMNKGTKDVGDFLDNCPKELASQGVRTIVAASPILLPFLKSQVSSRQLKIDVFAQNLHWQRSGAYTGECSVDQALEIGLKGSIIAHSERRKYFGESDESASNRCQLALSCGLHVIYCIGESLAERKSGQTEEVLKKQLDVLIETLSKELSTVVMTHQLIIAYEPIWAIGSGESASNQQIEESHLFLKNYLSEAKVPCPILYGGSVKPNNFADIAKIPNVYGALVGGASLEAKSFFELHRLIKET